MFVKSFAVILFLCAIIKSSTQNCPEEVSLNGISVTWPSSPDGMNIESDPLCYESNENLITRNCINSTWSPDLNELRPCMKVFKYFDLNSCPPGYFKISENNTQYCFQIGPTSAWDYPCYKSGAATVITDLDASEVDALLTSLVKLNISRYYWLPAQRQKYFNPIAWTIPGPNWSRLVQSNNNIPVQQFILRNCLLVDIQRKIIFTESCDRVFPSLCFYINDLDYALTCPEGYHSYRFMPNKGTCFGIEYTSSVIGTNFNDFRATKCDQPMGENRDSTLTRFVFKNMAEQIGLPDNEWCWFETSYIHNGSHLSPREEGNDNAEIVTEVMVASFEGIINNQGTLGLMNSMAPLQCMACEVPMIFNEPQLTFEYNNEKEIIYLTIYYPSGLWKYDPRDPGVQCFSNAKGFLSVVNVEQLPCYRRQVLNDSNTSVDKEVYKLIPVTDRSAQYWCEAHTQNFTLLRTKRIVVNPSGNDVHVFSLVITTDQFHNDTELFPNFTDVVANISDIFDADKVIVMEILNFTDVCAMLLLHLHISIEEMDDDGCYNTPQKTYERLIKIAEIEFPKHNIIFVNMSSSTHCFPTTSKDVVTLDWELTLIGQITAPKQFCLQSNGLPVKRQCGGSYFLGSIWGPVDGTCSKNYETSDTTTFLYNVAKGQTSLNYTTSFLTDGLNYVLYDTDIIIPADIYYLSMSFQYVLSLAQVNSSLVEIGDIKNIAWAMNRVMVLDDQYLRLSQTLNSTNVIVDSVNDIIEIIAQQDKGYANKSERMNYQLAAEPKFIAQISYPLYTNVTGIALINNSMSDDLNNMDIIPLYKNTTLDYILSLENVELATWIPEKVFTTLQFNVNDTDDKNSTEILYEDLHVVISIFYNDAVFPELDWRKRIMNSRIIGISIPGFISNLIHPVPLLFRPFNTSDTHKFCSYWDFHTDSSDTLGYWTNDGCYYVKLDSNLTMCECYHLTHFGQLISIDWNRDGDSNLDEKHTKALNVITLVGCFLSLLGIVGIWVTAIVFHSWRQKPGTKVLLQLTTSIALPLVLILVFNLDNTIFEEYEGTLIVSEHMIGVCIVLGALLHYSILSGFVWMLITAILQFIRYVRVLGVRRPSRFMVKFSLIGWGIPIFPVMIILIINKESYLPFPTNHDSYNGPICYPTGNYFIYAVVLPIIVILIVNIALFVSVMYSISRGPDGKMRSVDLDLIGAQLRLSIFLFFLLGLSWFFGILTFSNNVTWSYLFCLTSTLQGFVLFLYFVICDPTTRNLWVTLMRPQFTSRPSSTTSRESIVSINN